ncbi:hypothetical protein C2845_PM17G05110 [Panicum miliaceum]|uniref:Uncharacterized protein n=1 Tax=Panicum miliaceum TaxID=4540 RepID=A0A3L6PZT5_PANMI|nr:hypothetical protein C2845_PM17G05110 [Panicum miliaceum]
MKEMRAFHTKTQKMSRKGYARKRKDWEEEKYAAEGKENPWMQFPGRSRPYLRASDLYDLFNLDALDISLLRCFSFKRDGVRCWIVDPQLFSATGNQCKSNDVIDQIAKLMNNDFVVGAYNTDGHWVLCAQQPSWSMLCGFNAAINMMSLICDAKTYKKLLIIRFHHYRYNNISNKYLMKTVTISDRGPHRVQLYGIMVTAFSKGLV